MEHARRPFRGCLATVREWLDAERQLSFDDFESVASSSVANPAAACTTSCRTTPRERLELAACLVSTLRMDVGPTILAPGKRLRTVPKSLITDELLKTLEQTHHLDGVALANDPPMLLFHAASEKLIGDKVAFQPWPWPGVFGATLTIHAYTTAGTSRIAIPEYSPVVSKLRSGRFVAAFCSRRRLVAAFAVELSPDHRAILETYCDTIERATFVIRDPIAHSWENLDVMTWLHDRLTPSDRLSIGWVRRYSNNVLTLAGSLDQSKEVRIEPSTPPPNTSAALIEAVNASGRNAQSVCRVVEGIVTAGGEQFTGFLMGHREYIDYCHAATGHAHCRLWDLALDVYFTSPSVTDAGRRIAWLKKGRPGAELAFLELEPTKFPEAYEPEEWWRCIQSVLPFNLGGLVGPHDVPVDLGPESPAWGAFPLADNVADVNASADALIEEATAHKKWTIPNGAVLQLIVGPFQHFRVFESDVEVFFVGETGQGEFGILAVNLADRRLSFDALRTVPWKDDKPTRIEAAVRLLLAAMVRDFFVVEERARVFDSQTIRRPSGNRPDRANQRTVYLPRVKYLASPDLTRCSKELAHDERRAHFVGAHTRRVGLASEHQVALAARYGVEVPEGHTFVRPHERGKKGRDVVYRSRSALASLYEVSATPVGPPSDWFKFERDVAGVMIALGFAVVHRAAAKRGDHGIDLVATKGKGLDEVTWCIQCKCYSANRKIGPAVIRDLLGALASSPRGTRGMLVTTSAYSSGAKQLAHESNIRLIDGSEFLQMLSA